MIMSKEKGMVEVAVTAIPVRKRAIRYLLYGVVKEVYVLAGKRVGKLVF